MGKIRQSVDDRDGAILRQGIHFGLLVGADHNSIEVTGQHPELYPRRFAAADLQITGRKENRQAAELVYTDFKGYTGSCWKLSQKSYPVFPPLSSGVQCRASAHTSELIGQIEDFRNILGGKVQHILKRCFIGQLPLHVRHEAVQLIIISKWFLAKMARPLSSSSRDMVSGGRKRSKFWAVGTNDRFPQQAAATSLALSASSVAPTSYQYRGLLQSLPSPSTSPADMRLFSNLFLTEAGRGNLTQNRHVPAQTTGFLKRGVDLPASHHFSPDARYKGRRRSAAHRRGPFATGDDIRLNIIIMLVTIKLFLCALHRFCTSSASNAHHAPGKKLPVPG